MSTTERVGKPRCCPWSMSSSMDYAGSQIRDTIDRPVTLSETRSPDVRYPRAPTFDWAGPGGSLRVWPRSRSNAAPPCSRNNLQSRARPLGFYTQELPRHRIDLGEICNDFLIAATLAGQ